MIVYVTRHGQPDLAQQTQYPPGDPLLTDLGQLQARRLGRRLKEAGFSGPIYASPYQRTIQTAHFIAEELETTLYPEPALREWCGPGMAKNGFTGRTLDELRRLSSRIAEDAQLPYPWWTLEVDDAHTVKAKVRPFLDELMQSGIDQALLVGHGASTGACKLCLLEEMTVEDAMNADVNWNCSLTAIRVRPRVELLCLRDPSHMEPDQITSNLLCFKDAETQTERT